MATLIREGVRTLPVLASAARTATPTIDTYRIGKVDGLFVVIDVTAIAATPSITVTVDGVDEVSGKTFNLLTSAAISSVSTVTLRIRPGLTAVANLTASDMVPSLITFTVTHGDADSITYSVTAIPV